MYVKITSVQTQKYVDLELWCPSNSFISKYLLVHLCWRDPRCRETSAPPHSADWRRPSYIPPCHCWVDSLKPFTTEFGWAHADRGSCSSSSWQTDEVVFGNLKAQNKTTMTSTNMFQGLDTGTKPSSRVLQPPGGGSSNLFGGYEEDSAASRRPHKMASNVFAAPAEPQSVPRRSNPPGGKSSGIFGDPEPPAQPQRPIPPGGPTSNIFGAAEDAPVQSRSHPNKPKDNLSVGPGPESPAPEAKVSQPEVKEEAAPPPAPMPAKEEPAAVSAPPEPEPSSSSSSSSPPVERDVTSELKKHEPHLGPKPRSHNRVLNPPGGKSSVVFY